jgi:hypothetical protein
MQASKNMAAFQKDVAELKRLQTKFDHDPHIRRVKPFLDIIVRSAVSEGDLNLDGIEIEKLPSTVSENDKLSYYGHVLYLLYISKTFDARLQIVLKKMENLEVANPLGIIMTTYDLRFQLDDPLTHVITHIKRQSKSKKSYLDPRLLFLHVQVQLAIQDVTANPADEEKMAALDASVNRLSEAVSCVSVREPYTGKLSYRHVGWVLLQGYKEFFAKHNMQRAGRCLDQGDNEAVYTQIRNSATNFDLR